MREGNSRAIWSVSPVPFSSLQRHRDVPMPFLIGAATAATTLLSMACGQISAGFGSLGVLLAAAVLMTWREA
jgi:hypothetical protein